MRIITGDMWAAWDEADLFLFTSNGVVDKHGRLAMGGGIAKQVRDKFPGVDKALGRHIIEHHDPDTNGTYIYGLLVSENYPAAKLGALQTKAHYRDKSPIELVEYSCQKLKDWALAHENAIIHTNFPAVGLGGLTYTQVMPIVKRLPDNVHVWTNDPWWSNVRHNLDVKDKANIQAILDLEKLMDNEPDNFFPDAIEIKVGLACDHCGKPFDDYLEWAEHTTLSHTQG